MARSRLSWMFYVIIGLAVVGLFAQLLTSPGAFFKSILIMLGFGVLIFAVFYFVFFRNRAPSNDMKKYRKAARRSKARHKHNTSNKNKMLTPKQPSLIKKKRIKRSSTHLRVIEGNKSKRKDLASF